MEFISIVVKFSFRDDRDKVRALVKGGDFIEVYCKASVDKCEPLDVNGLPAKSRSSEIAYFTGIFSPYEETEIIVNTGEIPLGECIERVIDYLSQSRNYFPFVKCWGGREFYLNFNE